MCVRLGLWDCESWVTGGDGAKDVAFLGVMAKALDDFWGPRFNRHELGADALGLTKSVARTFSYRELQPEWTATAYRPLKIRLHSDSYVITKFRDFDRGVAYYPQEEAVILPDHAIRTGQDGALRGEAVWAFVIAHEAAHHVQKLAGIWNFIDVAPAYKINLLIERAELQADCLAGVFVHHHEDMFEKGEIEHIAETLKTIGDETHGTGQQRARWFGFGLTGGDPAACDAYSLEDAAL